MTMQSIINDILKQISDLQNLHMSTIHKKMTTIEIMSSDADQTIKYQAEETYEQLCGTERIIRGRIYRMINKRMLLETNRRT